MEHKDAAMAAAEQIVTVGIGVRLIANKLVEKHQQQVTSIIRQHGVLVPKETFEEIKDYIKQITAGHTHYPHESGRGFCGLNPELSIASCRAVELANLVLSKLSEIETNNA